MMVKLVFPSKYFLLIKSISNFTGYKCATLEFKFNIILCKDLKLKFNEYTDCFGNTHNNCSYGFKNSPNSNLNFLNGTIFCTTSFNYPY